MYSFFVALVVAAHLLFVVFAISGGLLALRWPLIAWVHLPTVAWAAFVEFSGRICPLTPLENVLRARAGLSPYTGDFIARYVFPVLYPAGLTRELQILIGAFVIAVNVAAYWWVIRLRRGPARRSVLKK